MEYKINKVTVLSVITILPLVLAAFFVLRSVSLSAPETKPFERNTSDNLKRESSPTPIPSSEPKENRMGPEPIIK